MSITVYQGYQIKPYKEVQTSYIIVTDGKGGKIPDVLSGFYTSREYAKLAINSYLNSKIKKDKADAEEGAKRGD